VAVDGRWHHVMLGYTFGTGDEVVATIDGQPTDGVWDMEGNSAAPPVVDNDDLWIGGSHGAGHTFPGLIEGLAIYVCNRIGQNRKYGLFNLKRARQDYSGIPAVFYTRKSLIHDAVAMFKAGANGLFIKPTGSDDTDTRRLTRAYAPGLLDDLRKVMGI